MTTQFRRHPDIRLTALDNEGVVLHLGTLKYFTVNETGLAILRALESPKPFEALVSAVTEEFDVSVEVAERTTREFLTQCLSSGLLREEAV